jgi:broad specificity phosphatase PhoE
MRLYILRHADKEQGDFSGREGGSRNQPISAAGRMEAGALGAFFRDKRIDRIYVSTYLRTQQTAACVAERLWITPVVDSRLDEIDTGAIERLTEEEIRLRYTDFWRAYTSRSADFRFPEGETGTEAQRRIAGFIEEKKNQGEDILVVSHDGLIRCLLCYIVGIPVYRRYMFQVDTCGLMEIEHRDPRNGWKLIRFNQKHVGGVGA